MPRILTEIFDIFFPEECINCGQLLQIKGRYFCFQCLSDLTLAQFSAFQGNPVERTFRGRVPLVAGTSLFLFEKKGPVQKLLHELKYKGKPQIGIFLGHWLGEDIKRSKRFEGIDLVVQVPLHPKKERKRGYNQVSWFARTLAENLKADFRPELLEKVSEGRTQTHKTRPDRILDSIQEYRLRLDCPLKGMHILVVDDIITTGATLEACCMPFLQIPKIRISIASMAFTV